MKPMISDESLRNAVVNELDSDPEVFSEHLSVTAINGAVTLRGHVATYHEKHEAVRAADRVSAVRAVADEIQVKSSTDETEVSSSLRERADEEIAEEIGRLRGRRGANRDAVHVQVRDGRVIMYGQVDSDSQRDAAESAARQVTGVRAVSNLIDVKPETSPTAADVERLVREAVAQVADLDACSVRVTMRNGTAHLGGHVASLVALQSAVQAAESAPGVTTVKSGIIVTVQ